MRVRNPPLVAGAVLAAFGVLVFGGYVRAGGFAIDDWLFADAARRSDDPVSFRSIYQLSHGNMRPLHALFIYPAERILGTNVAGHLALTLLLAVVAALALYGVLRAAGAPFLPALAAGALLLVFPFADALRFWTAAGWINFALILALAGGWALMRTVDGRRRWLVLAVVLDVAGVLFYEQALPVIAGGIVFVALRDPRRAVLQRCGGVAAAAALAAATVLITGTPARSEDSGPVAHFLRMLGQTPELLGRSLSPAADAWRVAAVLVLVLVVAAAACAWRSPALRAALRPWLVWGAVGVAVIVASYAVFAPAVDWYAPLTPGQGTRTNASAAIGWVLLVIGLAGVLSVLVARITPVPAAAALAVAVVLIATLWTVRTRADGRQWIEGSKLQAQVLDVAERSPELAAAPPQAQVFVFGTAEPAPGVPVFIDRPDLGAALRIRLHRPLLGVPVFTGTGPSCGRLGPATSGGARPVTTARYGRSYFLDVAGGRVLPVPDRATCATLLAGLATGPAPLTPAA